jgi:hypothetical protein
VEKKIPSEHASVVHDDLADSVGLGTQADAVVGDASDRLPSILLSRRSQRRVHRCHDRSSSFTPPRF